MSDKEKTSKGQWHGGKGSIQKGHDHDKYAENFDKIFGKNKSDKTPNTLQEQAWKRALENSKPNAGTPHDWEDYEQQKNKNETK